MSHTDRELLELAAKAAGIKGEYIEPHGIFQRSSEHGPICWNPLHDDGEALRLVVWLGLAIAVEGSPASKSYASRYDVMSGRIEPHGHDPYAATRRAIVLAAAEIGKEAV